MEYKYYIGEGPVASQLIAECALSAAERAEAVMLFEAEYDCKLVFIPGEFPMLAYEIGKQPDDIMRWTRFKGQMQLDTLAGMEMTYNVYKPFRGSSEGRAVFTRLADPVFSFDSENYLAVESGMDCYATEYDEDGVTPKAFTHDRHGNSIRTSKSVGFYNDKQVLVRTPVGSAMPEPPAWMHEVCRGAFEAAGGVAHD